MRGDLNADCGRSGHTRSTSSTVPEWVLPSEAEFLTGQTATTIADLVRTGRLRTKRLSAHGGDEDVVLLRVRDLRVLGLLSRGIEEGFVLGVDEPRKDHVRSKRASGLVASIGTSIARGLAIVVTLLLLAMINITNPVSPADRAPIRLARTAARAMTCDRRVSPGDNLQRALSRAGKGKVICFSHGLYRMAAALEPYDGQKLVAERGTILNGSKRLTTWTPSGALWTSPGAVPLSTNGLCELESDGSRPTTCTYRDNVFLDDVLLTRVASLSELASGRVYIDYSQGLIYIADDPTGRRVEIAQSFSAVRSALRHGDRTNNVTVKGFVIEKFANPAQFGAIQVDGGKGWIISRNEARFNNGVGIRVNGRNQVVRNNYVHHNGQLGVGGITKNSLFAGNEIAFNNTKGYSTGWEAGGTKFAQSRYLTVRGNRVHDNFGPGLWVDGDNIHVLIEDNTVKDNTRDGIFYEISYGGTIRSNRVTGNGFGFCQWMYGAGILIATSSNVDVHHNVVVDNCRGITGLEQNRGSGSYGTYELAGLRVHHNSIWEVQDGFTGIGQDEGDMSVFTRHGNRFNFNTYHVDTSSGKYWAWKDSMVTWGEWRSYGNDESGSVRTP
jgi:parallel beta-helix repeat protein